MKIEYSLTFIKAYKKLSLHIKILTEEKVDVFLANPFDPRLKTHKLSGRLRGYWAFSIQHRYRIIFLFIDQEYVRFYAIGGHSLYE